jgi:hypothetical protein
MLLLCSSLFISAEEPQKWCPALRTTGLTVPADQAAFKYNSYYDTQAYIASTTTPITFTAVNISTITPDLIIDVPNGMEITAGIRNITLNIPQVISRDGLPYNRYVINTTTSSTMFSFLWKSTLPVDSIHTVYFRADWGTGSQPEQILTVKVLDLPLLKTFKNIPIWYSIPNDLVKIWPKADYQRGGFNAVGIWTYLHPNFINSWGGTLLSEAVANYADSDMTIYGWAQEWWWGNARGDVDGKSIDINGNSVSILNLLYRGIWFDHWLTAGRKMVDEGIYTHVVDPEIYRGVDFSTGYSPAAISDFQQYLTDNNISVTENNPHVFMNDMATYTDEVRIWRKWKAKKYTDFFVDYRAEMESYMTSKGITEPFKFIIYSTYHKGMKSFYDYSDYETSSVYVRTLEDPVDLMRAFDVFAPMNYPDIYGYNYAGYSFDYERYNMLEPYEDTISIYNLVKEQSTVMPMLSSGYPQRDLYYKADISTAMLRCNMLETIMGGAKGFGIWGVCPHDALDMQMTAKLIDSLVPAEEVIKNGVPFTDSPVSGIAFVKGIMAPSGGIILVSEYSTQVRNVIFKAPISGILYDLQTGTSQTVNKDQQLSIVLDSIRAQAFYIDASGSRSDPANGDFNGLNDWSLATLNGAVATFDNYAGQGHVNVTTTGTVKLSSAPFSFRHPGGVRTYNYSFKAHATTAQYISFGLRKDVYTGIAGKYIQLTPSEQTFSGSITTTDTASCDIYLNLQFGGTAGDIYFDEIIVELVPSDPANGDFNGLNDWTLNILHGGVATLDNYAGQGHVNVTTAGTVKLSSAPFSFQHPGGVRTYNYSFKAHATTTQYINLGLRKDVYTGLTGKYIQLSPTEQTFSGSITTTDIASCDIYLSLQFGGTAGDIYFDEIIIELQ